MEPVSSSLDIENQGPPEITSPSKGAFPQSPVMTRAAAMNETLSTSKPRVPALALSSVKGLVNKQAATARSASASNGKDDVFNRLTARDDRGSRREKLKADQEAAEMAKLEKVR